MPPDPISCSTPLQCPACQHTAPASSWDLDPPVTGDSPRHSPSAYVLKCPACGATPVVVMAAAPEPAAPEPTRPEPETKPRPPRRPRSRLNRATKPQASPPDREREKPQRPRRVRPVRPDQPKPRARPK